MTGWITTWIVGSLLIAAGYLCGSLFRHRGTAKHKAVDDSTGLQSRLSDSQARSEALQRERNQLTDRLRILQELCEDLVTGRERQYQERKQLEDQLQCNRELIFELEKHYQDEYHERIKSLDQLHNLKQVQLQHSIQNEQQSKDHQQRCQSLDSALVTSNEQIKLVTEERDKLLQSAGNSRTLLAELASQTNDQESQLHELRLELADCKSQLSQEQELNSELHTSITDLQNTLADKQAQAEEVRVENEARGDQLETALRNTENSLIEMTACAEDLSSRLNLTQIELVDASNKIATDSITFEEKTQQYIAERDDAFTQGYELVNRIQVEVQQRLKSLLEQRDSAFDKANRMLDDIRVLQSRAQSNEETIRNLRRERGAVLMRARAGQVEYPRLLETPLPDHEQRQTKPTSSPERINYGGKTRVDAIRGLVYTSPPRFIDDLKRISGIAAVLESKLNEYGIYTYEQIFSWDAEAIAEFSKLLVFKDRIDRDGWQAQARKHYHAKYVSRAA